MDESKVFMFKDGEKGSNIDPGLLALINNNGGFGNGGNWMWMMFLWLLYPLMSGGFNGFGGNRNDFIANLANNGQGRDLLLQAINGRADALGQLAGILNTSVETVKSGVNSLQVQVQNVASQVGMSGLQVVNAIQSGNASISHQLCECCCENRLAIANQTNALQSQMAANHAATQLQYAQSEAAEQLAMCQQTNTLQTQGERNTNSILNAIAGQNTLITKEFCDLKERELQNQITALTTENVALKQNGAFAAMLAPINAELAAIKAAQPATMTVPFNQYALVPTWAAQAGSDFVASYWANRLSQATNVGGTTA